MTTARIEQPENLLNGTPYRASAATILGKGAMGVVYLAEHAALGTKCVVKVLLPELAKPLAGRSSRLGAATSLFDVLG